MLTLNDMKYVAITILLGTFAIAACQKAKSPAAKPSIALRSVSHDSVVTGSFKDTVLIELRYTIARKEVEGTVVSITDKRDTTVNEFHFPKELSDSISNDLVNVTGTYMMRVPAAQYLIMRPDHPNGDTVQYEIVMKSGTGIESNKVTTSNIYILP